MEKELNREQIIKALECCSKWVCDECPNKDESPCTQATATDALSLINELTEENERLRDTAYRLECEVHRERADTVRKMQEFAHKEAWIIGEGWIVDLEVIDQIAKEVLEGKNEN